MKLKLERVLFCPLNKLKPLTKQEQNILSRLIRIQVLSNEQKELDMVSMPGALTPSEIISANEAGADFCQGVPC